MLPPLIHALLTDPACFDHPVEKPVLVETHISWVVLTGLYAYKIKKPVNMGFLDFSTLSLRHQDCIEELRLNRRLAADFYLDVAGIAGQPDKPRVGGVGEPFEYAVKMRQFPANNTLDLLAERGELGNVHIDALAQRLARFHLSECEMATDESAWGEPVSIGEPVAENFKILTSCLDDQAAHMRLAALQHWCNDEHMRISPLMHARKQDGRVRECHGDLHLANLAWVDGQLLIFDCLEFNPSLRWIDVMSEVAFCYMDLLHRNYAALASRFLNAWLEATGDYQGVDLLRYYAVYRALVRAKVAALRAAQLSDCEEIKTARADVTACLQLAETIAKKIQPKLWITHGLSGSGKTTLSGQLLEKHAAIRVRSDVERKRLAGLGLLGELYSQESGHITYEYLAQRAEALLKAGWPVIVDAAFLDRSQRQPFRDLARRLLVDFQILDIQAEPAILRERILRRQSEGHDASDAGLRVLQHQLTTARPLEPDELPVSIQTDGLQD